MGGFLLRTLVVTLQKQLNPLLSFHSMYIDFLGTCDICCWNQSCRLAFPMSICTGMGQCCCIDLRIALPCDPSKVPITVGVLGLLCLNLDRKRVCACCSKYTECNLDQFCPCFDPACCGFDERKFEDEVKAMTMNGRSEVFSKDTEGNAIVTRRPTYAELWHFRQWEKRKDKGAAKRMDRIAIAIEEPLPQADEGSEMER